MSHDHHYLKAMLMLDAAKPASGFRPETPEEWEKLHRALEEMGYACLRSSGMSDARARALARETYGSPGFLLLVDLAFSEAAHVKAAQPKNDLPGGIK